MEYQKVFPQVSKSKCRIMRNMNQEDNVTTTKGHNNSILECEEDEETEKIFEKNLCGMIGVPMNDEKQTQSKAIQNMNKNFAGR